MLNRATSLPIMGSSFYEVNINLLFKPDMDKKKKKNFKPV